MNTEVAELEAKLEKANQKLKRATDLINTQVRIIRSYEANMKFLQKQEAAQTRSANTAWSALDRVKERFVTFMIASDNLRREWPLGNMHPVAVDFDMHYKCSIPFTHSLAKNLDGSYRVPSLPGAFVSGL